MSICSNCIRYEGKKDISNFEGKLINLHICKYPSIESHVVYDDGVFERMEICIFLAAS